MDKAPATPEELVRVYGPVAYAIGFRIALRHDLAEDAAAKALHSAWSRRGDFDGRSSFKTWVARIAVNAAIDLVRRERAAGRGAVPLDETEDNMAAPAEDSPSAAVEREDESRMVKAALASLSESHRAVLVLREWEGMPYQEIAAALRIPIGTVMSRLSHARRILKSYLEER